jgi:subtilisin family serine protease
VKFRELLNRKPLWDLPILKRIRGGHHGFWKRLIVSWIRLTAVLGVLWIFSMQAPFLPSGVASSSALTPQNDQGDLALSSNLSTDFLAPYSLVLDPPDEPESEELFQIEGSGEGIAVVDGEEVLYYADLSDEVKVIVALREDPVAVHLHRLRSEGEIPQALLSADILTYANNLEKKRDELVTNLQGQGLIDQVTRRFSYLVNGFTATVRMSDIRTIERWAEVQAVYLDEELHITLEQSVPLIGAPTVWAMTDGVGNPATGLGMTVAIIDTGIDYTHPDLGGCFGDGCRVVGGYDFVNGDSDPMDDHGHGTHVAGIVAANGTFTGVAPGVHLLAYKACNLYGSCNESDVIAALEQAVDPDGDPTTHDQPEVINMSLAKSGASDSPLGKATDRAVEQGIVVVVAAGNNGEYHGIGSPGAAAKALTVGASTKGDSTAYFSSRGPVDRYVIKPDVMAPGVDITSTFPGNQYGSLDGTSMASPHVAGAAVLLVQLHPEWSPDQVKAVLMNTAKSLGVNPYIEGTGRIQVDKAAVMNTIVKPATLSMGRVDPSQSTWTAVGKFEIFNEDSVNRTYHISVDPGLPDGVTTTLSADTITIDPGQSVSIQLTLIVDTAQLSYPPEEPFAYYGKVLVSDGTENISVPFAFIRDTQMTLRFDEEPWMVYIHDRGVKNVKAFITYPDLTVDVPLVPGIYDVIVVFKESGTGIVVREDLVLSDDLDLEIERTDAIYKMDARIRFEDGSEAPAFPRSYSGVAGIFHRSSHKGLWFFGGLSSAETTHFSPMSAAYYYETNGFLKYEDNEPYYDLFYYFEGIQGDLTLTNDVQDLKRLDYSIPPLHGGDFVRVYYLMVAPVTDRSYYGALVTLEQCSSVPVRNTILRSPQPASGVLAPYRFVEVYRMDGCSSTKERIGDSPFVRVEDRKTFVAYAYDRIQWKISKLYESTAEDITFNLSPIYWSGVFQAKQTSVRILSDLATAGWNRAFLRDQWQNMLRYDVPYILRQDEEVIQSGELRSESGAYLWSSELFSPGRVSMDLSYRAWLQGIPVQGFVAATLDTRRDDRSPPSIRALQILSNGNMTDRIAGDGQVQVEVIDDVQVQTVELSIDRGDGSGWQNLLVTRQGDVFSADLSSIRAGDQVALKISAEDASGNRLINEIRPAFLGISQFFFPAVKHDTGP